MQPLALIGLLGALWALLHLWLLPLMRDHWKSGDMRVKAARAGVLVAAEKLRDLAFIGATVAALVLALVAAANALGGAGVVWPKALIETAATLYKTAKDFADGYAGFISTLAALGAAIVLWMTARQAKARVVEVWMAKAKDSHAALCADPSVIDAARDDPELRVLVQQIDESVAKISAQNALEEPDKTITANANGDLSQALSMLAIESARKQIDFAAAAGMPAKAEAATPANGWRRIAAVLASERLGKDLGLIRKPMGWAVTGLLVVSMVGWAAEPMANSLQLAVNNLRIQQLEHEAQRNLDEVLSKSEANTPKDETAPKNVPASAEAVQTASRLLARAATREIARSSLLDRGAGLRRPALAEAEFVRAALADQHIPAAAVADEAAARIRSELAAKPNPFVQDLHPSTTRQLEAGLTAPLQRMQQRQPAAFATLLERLEARYANVMMPTDAQSKLTAKLLDEVFGAVDAKPEGELGKQAQKLSKEFGKEAVKTWANAAVKQFVADTLAGTARAEVVRGFAFEASVESRRFITSLNEMEGQGWQSKGIAHAEAKAAHAVAEKVSGLHSGASAAERQLLVERLAGYDGLFPPEHGSPTGGGGGGGGRPSANGPSKGGVGPQASSGRATSFHAASRSFRVRGVIVGRDLDGSALDVVDIQWKVIPPLRADAATRIAVDLRISDTVHGLATWRVAGTFDAGVLNQAIRYAADRRVIATTITAGDGKAVARLTYLHPTLLDTPLGCRIVEADRWVDTFTMTSGNERMSSSLAELGSDRQKMYKWMSTLELAESVATLQGRACPQEQVAEIVKRRGLGSVQFSANIDRSLNTFIATRASASSGSEQFLRKATACATRPREALAACLCDDFRASGLAGRYWFPEDHTSQVRERPARLTSDLSWLKPSTERLAHWDFWTHTTFSLRDRESGAADESNTAALDFPAPQLAALRMAVSERLPRHLSDNLRSTSYNDFVGPLEEFVLAQRMARAAINGQLGRDFPLQKLLDLDKQTRRYVAVQPTIRWEPRGSAAELHKTLVDSDAHAADRFRSYLSDQSERAKTRQPVCGVASK